MVNSLGRVEGEALRFGRQGHRGQAGTVGREQTAADAHSGKAAQINRGAIAPQAGRQVQIAYSGKEAAFFHVAGTEQRRQPGTQLNHQIADAGAGRQLEGRRVQIEVQAAVLPDGVQGQVDQVEGRGQLQRLSPAGEIGKAGIAVEAS